MGSNSKVALIHALKRVKFTIEYLIHLEYAFFKDMNEIHKK